jgi:microcystin-dependent protein
MAEKISETKGLGYTPAFDTYVPELSDNADIQNALEYFYYGNAEDGNTIDPTNSIYSNLIDFDNRIDSATAGLSGHIGGISDVHGVGAGNSVVGTGTEQTLTNKRLDSPKINENVVLTATATELNYVDGVTSSVQTQLNTNTPVGMISIHAGSSAPTGWLLCDGTSHGSATYPSLFGVVGYTFGGSGASFNVPNLKGKVVVGIDAAQAQFDSRGETGGQMTHQHAGSNSGGDGSHSHSTDDHSHNTTDHSHNTPDHSHYADHSHYSDHSHAVNPGTTSTTSNGDHDHNGTVAIPNSAGINAASTTTIRGASNSGHTHDFNTGNSGNHSHSVNIASFNSGNSNYGNTANANGAGVTTGGANAGNTTGGASAGNTTGGASAGNNTSLSSTHTHTISSSDSLSNLQPYIALNYIIKI